MIYAGYFGLSEPGFSITPDPRFLYLSEAHREALAHLLYGIGEGGGFVLLTGEVGTGKTLLCRTFLEQIPEQVDVALILNPALTAAELLHAICDEYRIVLPDETPSIRLMLARLNDYLLAAHGANRKPLLLIDEAQNLMPEVLEQIRLLTNLETHTHKLLQIFLVGQPELREMLRSPALRQLSQRITARYHLKPLNRREASAYITHRLAIAGAKRPLFTASAQRRIHKLSGGVPRLINTLCDRALLGAFVTGKTKVDRRIIDQAADELLDLPNSAGSAGWWVAVVFVVLFLLVGGLFLNHQDPYLLQPEKIVQHLERLLRPTRQQQLVDDASDTAPITAVGSPITQEPLAATQADESPGPQPADSKDRMEVIKPNAPGEQSGDNRSSPAAIEIAVQSEPQPSVQPVALETLLMDRREGLRQLLARWGIVPEENYRGADLCDWALQQGVRCRESNGGWKQIQQYDRPAMIELTGRPKQRYALVTGIGPRYATLTQGDRSSRILREELDAHWRGSFLLLWRPPPDGVTLIGPGANQNYAAWLQQRLAHIPGFAVSFHPPASYDRQLQDAIRRFQQQQGLQTDGLVGPETIIALNSQASVADTPRLEQTE